MCWSLRPVVWYTGTRYFYGLLGMLFGIENPTSVIVFNASCFVYRDKLMAWSLRSVVWYRGTR